jgi:hypothetical protein
MDIVAIKRMQIEQILRIKPYEATVENPTKEIEERSVENKNLEKQVVLGL